MGTKLYSGPVLFGALFLHEDYIRPTVEATITVGDKSQTYIAWVDSGATKTVGSFRLKDELLLDDLQVDFKDTLKNVSSAFHQNGTLPTYKVKIKINGTDGTCMEDEIFLGILPYNIDHIDADGRACDILIGLDVIQHAEFVYNRKQIFSFSFIEENKKKIEDFYTEILKSAEEQFGQAIIKFDGMYFEGNDEPVTYSTGNTSVKVKLPEYLLQCGKSIQSKYQLSHEVIHCLSKASMKMKKNIKFLF